MGIESSSNGNTLSRARSKNKSNMGGPSDILGTYLREINETPLLSAEEEKELAFRIGEGDTEARDSMVKANLRLVVNIARGLREKGLPLQDLIEEGNLGLLRAVEGFDPRMNTRFSTYASYWIKQTIKRALVNTSRTIRIPVHMVEMITKWNMQKARMEEHFGRTPTDEEIGRALGLPKKKMQIVKKALKLGPGAQGYSDSDADTGFTLDEFFVDRSNAPADVQAIQREQVTKILALLHTLEPREVEVLTHRLGLEGEEPKTLREIGEILGITRERTRQIESEALRKLAEKLEEKDD